MKQRREKGLVVVIGVIILCLFLLIIKKWFDVPFPQFNNEKSVELPQVINSDISLTDSAGIMREQEESIMEESVMDDLTFLVNNLSYERRGSEKMTVIFSAILILYLLAIGPFSYFYCKKRGKMERMWLMIPVFAIGFGCGILFFANDFRIREPQTDLLMLLVPGQQTTCYVASTSPGEASYTISFDEKVESLQPWIVSNTYEINEQERTLTLYPESAFERNYFQFSVTEKQTGTFQNELKTENNVLTGSLVNETGHDFSKVMICFGEYYCIKSSVAGGEEIILKADDWRKKEVTYEAGLKEELNQWNRISRDERQILNFAWYRHENDGGFHITGITKEGDPRIIEDNTDVFFYSLYYQ